MNRVKTKSKNPTSVVEKYPHDSSKAKQTVYLQITGKLRGDGSEGNHRQQSTGNHSVKGQSTFCNRVKHGLHDLHRKCTAQHLVVIASCCTGSHRSSSNPYILVSCTLSGSQNSVCTCLCVTLGAHCLCLSSIALRYSSLEVLFLVSAQTCAHTPHNYCSLLQLLIVSLQRTTVTACFLRFGMTLPHSLTRSLSMLIMVLTTFYHGNLHHTNLMRLYHWIISLQACEPINIR